MVGGAELASAALSAELVDEYHLLIAPYVAGGGKAALPERMTLRLELQDHKCFRSGMVNLRYRVERADRDAMGSGVTAAYPFFSTFRRLLYLNRCRNTMEITNRTVHDVLAAHLLQEFGWRVTIEADDDSGVWAALPVPGRDEHWLRFRSEVNSIEVSYWDAATPPKPAEQLFVIGPEELNDAVAEGVVLFLRALTNDEVVVVRDQSGCVASLFGAPASAGGLRFKRQADILRAGMAKNGIVYTWSQASNEGL